MEPRPQPRVIGQPQWVVILPVQAPPVPPVPIMEVQSRKFPPLGQPVIIGCPIVLVYPSTSLMLCTNPVKME